MFRKDEEARLQWSSSHVKACALRQAEILDNGAAMLKPGGRLVYSTCTFAPEENEESIRSFLERHPEFQVEKPELSWDGFSCGCSQWTVDPEDAREKHLEDTIRIWPHKTGGEGHYMAVLRKKKSLEQPSEETRLTNKHGGKKEQNKREQKLDNIQRRILETFLTETLTVEKGGGIS